MSKKRKCIYLAGDFETTVYKGQMNTEVWASACVELNTEDVHIFHSIEEQFEYLKSLKSNICMYYHNLKFDGSFWLSYLLVDLHFKQAYDGKVENNTVEFMKNIDMPNNSVKYSISEMGQWYSIVIKTGGKIIELRDSLKLLPFSLSRIGKSFKTKHQKLEMEYEGFRYAGCEITDEEKEYIANDVLVLKEALEIMFKQGHNKLTIGSCCLAEYRKSIMETDYKAWFPNLTEVEINEETFGSKNAEEYIRKSYHGGWCYVVKGKEKKIALHGVSADVNSLYPSMMSSESGNKYPVGLPTFWKGNYIPNEALLDSRYYFIRVKTKFYIKHNYLPFIQVKNSFMYHPREMLETSDILGKDGKYYDRYIDLDGNVQDATVTMTLTMTDYKLMLDHYVLKDFEILDGCYFWNYIGLFDDYINKYKKIKQTTKGAERELAKLFLNNLYGKMATSTNSSFKVAYVKEDKSLGFDTIIAYEKKPIYIPVGSAITSYARNFTIRTAQKNYYGVDKRGFIYADTDSIHCDLNADELVDVPIHPTDFCHWKLESYWDYGIFVRQKTYIEHITHEDGEPIDEPYFNVKCAGMPERCKELFIKSMLGETDGYKTEDEKKFLQTKRELTDFDIGLTIPSKLLPKRIRGGVLLVDSTYQMR